MYVKVRVSAAYALLRETQRRLNDFVWSTEISYCHTLADDELQSQRDCMVDEVLAGIKAEAWYPPSRHEFSADEKEESLGRGKYRHTTDNFLNHIERNTRHIYLNCIVMFSTVFEEYLESKRDRIDPREPNGKPKNKWGPYCQSLCGTALHWEPVTNVSQSQRPVQSKTILNADVARLLRNEVVHHPAGLSTTAEAALPDEICKKLFRNLESSNLWQARVKTKNYAQWRSDLVHSSQNAVNSFLGSAEHKMKRARETQGKELPIEFFYMLFTLTALDALAFEIEEALIKDRSEADSFVLIDNKRVRRTDLLEVSPRAS